MRKGRVCALFVIALALCSSSLSGDGAILQSRGGAPEAPRVKTVRVKGASLAYVEQGRGEPVVLIHGFLHDYRVWSEQMEELSKRYRVIAYSRRYHWPNTLSGDGSDLSATVDEADLVGLIKALKLGRVHLVGHSAGANIALPVARDHPKLVRSLVLGEPVMQALLAQSPEAEPLFSPALIDEARQAFEHGDRDGALLIVATAILGDKAAVDRLAPFAQTVALDNMWEFKQLWAPAVPDSAFACADARRIKAPTLLLGGESSPKLFQLSLQELQKCMPGSERAVLPQSSHGLELENPAKFNEIVLEFLTRHSSRARRR